MHRVSWPWVCALLGACGGGSDSAGRQSTTNDAYLDFCSPGGLWRASDGGVAIIGQSLDIQIVMPSGVQFVGSVDGEGYADAKDTRCWFDSENSTLHVALPIGAVLPGGSTAATGHVDGSWKRRQGVMSISGRLTTTAGNLFMLGFEGTYDPLYADGSNAARIVGTYGSTAGPNTEVVTVDSGRRIFGQNAAAGCVLNGTIEPVDPEYNTYGLKASYANCTGPASVLNGNPAKGLACFDGARNPAELFIALDVAASSQHFSVVRSLRRL